MLSIIIVLLAAPIFFFLPGYFVSLFLPWVRGVAARIAVSLVTSVALGVIIATGAAFAHARVGLALFGGMALLSAIFGFLARGRLRTLAEEWSGEEKKRKIIVAAIIFFAIGAGTLVSVPHFGYPWPIHADEWWDVGTVQSLLEGWPLHTHPYLFNEFVNWKPGITAFLAGVFNLANVDPVAGWAYLPGFNLFLITLTAALAVFSLTRSALAALLTLASLAALRSNAYVLGWWFFVPSTFAFLFVIPLILFASEWVQSRRGAWWALMVGAALALVYAPFAALAALALFFAMRRELFARHTVLAWSVVVLVVVAVVFALLLSPYAEYWRLVDVTAPLPLVLRTVLDAFFVPIGATLHFFRAFSFLDLVTLPLLALALLGVWRLRRLRENAWARALLAAALLGAANVLLIQFFDISFVVFHQRAFTFAGVVAALLTAGVLPAGRQALHITNLVGFIRAKGAVVVLGIIALVWMFSGYFTLPSGAIPYRLVDEVDLRAMEWLKQEPSLRGATVFADPAHGTIVTPLTRLPSKVSFLTTQNVSAAVEGREFVITATQSCAEKEPIIRHMGAEVIYGHLAHNCPFLREIYRDDSLFIYRSELR